MHLGEINVPVACGGVVVEPGDMLVADDEGIAVIPLRHIADVAAILRSRKPSDISPEALRGRAEARIAAYNADVDKAFGVRS